MTDDYDKENTMEQNQGGQPVRVKYQEALKSISGHQPRKHHGRSRTFVNWQNAYFEIKAIANRAVGCTCGPTDGCEAEKS